MSSKGSFERVLLTCNPWFLSSAVILLYGIYSVQMDSNFISTDEGEVLFSFFTLQIYEFMALLSAWLFMRRKIYEDTVLLIVIVALLSMIPYLNLSQALQLESDYSLAIALATSLLVLLKFFYVKKTIPGINLPWRLLVPCLLVLLINVWVPLEVKKIESDATLTAKPFLTFLVFYGLPVLALVFSLVNRGLKSSGEVYNSKWLPFLLGFIWFSFTVINLVSVEFVYSISLRFETIVTGGLLLLYLISFQVENKLFRSVALMLVNISFLALTDSFMLFLGFMALNCLLSEWWRLEVPIKALQWSLFILPICCLFFDDGLNLRSILPFSLLIYAALLFVHYKTLGNHIALLILSFLFLSQNSYVSFALMVYALSTFLAFSLFMIKQEYFMKYKVWIFSALLVWSCYAMNINLGSLPTANIYLSALLVGVVFLKSRELGGLPYYFFSPVVFLLASPLSKPLIKALKGLPFGALVIAFSFFIFAIGFALNLRRSQKVK